MADALHVAEPFLIPDMDNSLNVLGAYLHRRNVLHRSSPRRHVYSCSLPTCPICSRTCNGCPPSAPPTPRLTDTSRLPDTPPISPIPNHNALSRRPALTSNTNIAQVAPPTALAGRRRKVRDGDSGDDGVEGHKWLEWSEEERDSATRYFRRIFPMAKVVPCITTQNDSESEEGLEDEEEGSRACAELRY